VKCVDIPAILLSEPRSKACERVALELPDCVCENESVEPNLSPGIVGRTETLARFVSEHDIDEETRLVTPRLFSHAGAGGMSVTRIEQAGVEALANQQRTKKYIGFVSSSCGAVRDLRWEGKQTFCVYDTAIPDNSAHADVCQAVFRPKSKVSEMRRTLQLAFTKAPISAV
jgi:hypothetical protein